MKLNADAPDNAMIAKLKKVMALMDSPSEEEAAAAAATLARLCEKHNLSIAEVEAAGDGEAPGIVEAAVNIGGGRYQWKLLLGVALSKHYYCHVLTSRDFLFFLGRQDNVEMCRSIYVWLVDELKRMSRAARREQIARFPHRPEPNAVRWQTSFGVGAVSRIKQRLEGERWKHRTNESTALVSLRENEVDEFIAEEFPDIPVKRVDPPVRNAAAYVAGGRAAEDVNLAPFIGSGEKRGELK